MKTVLGSVMSTKAVSLSKAARILSKFASSDNGASPAFSAYLRRASASFDELVQLHKAFKGKKSHVSIGIVKKSNEDGMFTSERKKKHKGKKTGEGEARELESSLKLDDEKQRHKKRRDEGEGRVGMRIELQNSEGIVDKKKSSASDLANVDNVMAVDGVKPKPETESQNKDSDTKKRKNKDKDDKDHNVGPVKIENEEQVNRKTCEIENQNGHKETTKKKRDKYEKGKLEGVVKIENEDQGYPLGRNREATEFVENDGSEQKKHNKKRKKEKDIIVAGDAEQRNPSDGGDANVHEVSNRIKVESGEGKKHKKKRNHENKESESGGMVDVIEKESRKRKHEEDGRVQFDDTEEKHRAKKKKKTGVDY